MSRQLSTGLLLLIAARAFAAASIPLTATMGSVTVPPGATAQLQIFLTTPQTLVSGGATIALDPKIFDNITAVDVYSATGDQVGAANINGRNVDVEFTSQTGGIGRLLALPTITITVPILPIAVAGATTMPSFGAGTTAWADTQGQQYSVSLAGGTLTVGGSLSIASVTPAGANVTINGTGFTAGSTVQIDGLAIAATQLVSPQQIDAMLAEATDLAGHRIAVQNAVGLAVSFFYTLHGTPINRVTTAPLGTVQPIFPFQLYSAATIGCGCPYQASAEIALQNPTSAPVQVTLFGYGIHDPTAVPEIVTIPAGSTYFGPTYYVEYSTTYALAATPIRMVTVFANSELAPIEPTIYAGVAAGGFTLSPPQVTLYGVYGALSFSEAAGGAAPSPQNFLVLSLFPTNVTTAASTASGGQWLSVSPQQASACVGNFNGESGDCSPSSMVTVSVDSSKLSPGTYNGNVTVTPQGANAQSSVVPVVLNVYGSPWISTDFYPIQEVSFQGAIGEPSPFTFAIASSGPQVAFTATAATQSGQKWLSVSPSQGQAPANLTITFTASAFSGSSDVGTVTVVSPANTLTITINATESGPSISPPSLGFTGFVGGSPPPPQLVDTGYFDPSTVSVTTATGGNWLAAVGNGNVTVSVNQAGLAAGSYQGTITLTSPYFTQTVQVPVTFSVVSGPVPPVSVSSAALSFTAAHGGIAIGQLISVSAGGLALPYTVSSSANWLTVEAVQPATTPGSIDIAASAANLLPGTYTGSVTITTPYDTGSTSIPVTFTVTPAPTPLPPTGTVPLVTAVVNSASQTSGPLAPGEIVTIYGQNLGPPTPSGATVGSNGLVSTTNGDFQVLFGGTAAPLLYVSATQINAIVPFEAGYGTGNTSVFVQSTQYGGSTIPAGTFESVAAAPAIFTVNASGRGQAAVLNQDGTLNSSSNPAARGSAVQIYASGAGITSPEGSDGGFTYTTLVTPGLPISLTIGGVAATVAYAAGAPGEVNAVLQVNAMVPESVTAGSSVPVVLTVGGFSSGAAATIAVK